VARKQLDIYGAEDQGTLLRGARAYCTLGSADGGARQRVFSPEERPKDDTASFDAHVARYAVRRLCPDRTDLLPAAG